MITKNLKNLSLFFVKSAVAVKTSDNDDEQRETEEIYQDINDFVLCEKSLAPIGKTCYLSSVLLALNSCRRYVLSYLMRDPFPFQEDSLSQTFRTFLKEFR